MKFSVLMSLYKKENPAYLSECLESLKNQTVPAAEIVLVFDGEITPELERAVEHYRTLLPLNIVRLPTNLGLGNALNEGLKHCRYDWVFRMDTDDVCVPQRFEKQRDFIMQYPQTVIFGGQIAEFNRYIEDIVSYRRVPQQAAEIRRFAQKRSPFNHMTVAYRKSAVQAAGGYRELQEDYWLWLNMIAANPQKTANLPDVLVYARIGNGMVGRRHGFAQAACEWRLFRLKKRLGIQGVLSGFAVFLLRAVPRLLPLWILQILYKMLRK